MNTLPESDREHVVALLVDDIVLFGHVELPEEVEGDDGVEVHRDGQQHHGQDQLGREQRG